MKKFNVIVSVLFAFMILLPFAAYGQIDSPTENEPRINPNRRSNLLTELDLSPEQIRSVRRVNQENRFSIREVQARLREANANLDAAIYADAVDEADFQRRVKDVQNAQIEVTRARSANELAIRKILNAGQLIKFRELRRRFAENRQEARPNMRQRRLRDLPNRRFNNRRRQSAPND